jgi:Uma2 family endonuclease
LGGENRPRRTSDPVVAAAPEIHRWSPEDYHRLVETGALEDLRVELIDGFIVDMCPRSPAHDYAMQWLDDALRSGLDTSRHGVRVGMALSLGDSEPEPDIAIVAAGRHDPYHPATAALAVEVSHSSLSRDLSVKPRIYANAGIPRYWVIDLDGRRAVVHSEPATDGYARVETCGPDATLSAPELGVSISLAELLDFAIR